MRAFSSRVGMPMLLLVLMVITATSSVSASEGPTGCCAVPDSAPIVTYSEILNHLYTSGPTVHHCDSTHHFYELEFTPGAQKSYSRVENFRSYFESWRIQIGPSLWAIADRDNGTTCYVHTTREQPASFDRKYYCFSNESGQVWKGTDVVGSNNVNIWGSSHDTTDLVYADAATCSPFYSKMMSSSGLIVNQYVAVMFGFRATGTVPEPSKFEIPIDCKNRFEPDAAVPSESRVPWMKANMNALLAAHATAPQLA